MRRISEWLSTRTPSPPEQLAARLEELAADREFDNPSELCERLVMMAEELLAHIGDNRAAATDLLAADALITYAMEAAADSGDQVETLARVTAIRVAS